MANAKIDTNHTKTLIGVSSADGVTIVPAQINPVTGRLLVDVSSSGGGTSSTFGSAFPSTGTAVGFKDSTGTNMLPGNLDASGNLKVNIAAGSAGNAAASATGSAVPSSADYQGLNVAGNLRGHTGVNPSGSVYAAQMDITSVGGTTFALGQATMAASIPVTFASNQSALSVTVSNASLAVTGTFYQATQPVSIAATVAIGGDTANAASDAGNPVKIGGVGHTANPTAVTDGQRVNATFDKLGKQVVVGSIRDLKVNQVTTITGTTETTILTAVASTFLDMYGLIITNTSAVAVNVAIKDSTAGTTQFNIAVPAGDTRGFMLGESGGIKQTTVNNNWTATVSAAATSIIITALAVKNT